LHASGLSKENVEMLSDDMRRWDGPEGSQRSWQRPGLDVWVPVMSVTSCDLRILMDQPIESISS
jgi:hypothetical protein